MRDPVLAALQGEIGRPGALPRPGRHALTATVEPDGGPAEILLRADPAMGLVSGDVFRPGAGQGSHRLGGRDDWAYSFLGRIGQGDATDAGPEVAVCDVTVRVRGGVDRIGRKGTLSLCPGPGGRGVTARFDLDARQGGGWLTLHRWTAGTEATPDPAFRRLRLSLYVHEKAHEHAVGRAALDRLLGDPDDPTDGMLAEALLACDIRAEIRLAPPNRRPADGRSYWEAVERELYVRSAEDALDWDRDVPPVAQTDWSHTILLAWYGDDRDAAGGGGAIEYGKSFGLGVARTRWRSRCGAVINARRVLGSVDEAPGDTPVDRAAWLLRYNILHELAHLLNIPHPWERSRGPTLLGPSAPDALTVTNYGARHPYGAVLAARYDAMGDDDPIGSVSGDPAGGGTKAAALSRRRAAFYAALGDAGYDRDERRFLRHAPLDEIAPGGGTFLDGDMPAPSFARPSRGDVTLPILVKGRDGDAYLPVDRITLPQWRTGEGAATDWHYPLIPAWIALAEHRATGVEAYFDFRHSSGAVQILYRGVAQGPAAPWSPVPPVVAHNPAGPLDTARPGDGVDVPATRNEGVRDLAAGATPRAMLAFPWLRRAHVAIETGRAWDEIDLQVVYYVASRPVHSGLVRLSFRGVEPFPDDRDRADPMAWLPPFAEATTVDGETVRIDTDITRRAAERGSAPPPPAHSPT